MEQVSSVLKRITAEQSQNPKIIQTQKIGNSELCSEMSKREDILRGLCLSEPLKTFGNFKEAPGLLSVKQAFREVADGVDDKKFLLCSGSSGCGKTHLLKATSLRLYGRHIYCRYLEWYRIVQVLKEGFGKNTAPSYEKRLENYCKATAVLIDDYGLGSTNTDWEKSQLEAIINYRYEHRLLTIITTNLSNDAVPDRVISRFRDKNIGQIVVNRAGDYRRTK